MPGGKRDTHWRRGAQVNKLEITTDKQLLAAAGNPQIRLFEVNSNNPQPVLSFDSHSNNVTAVRTLKVFAVQYVHVGGAGCQGGRYKPDEQVRASMCNWPVRRVGVCHPRVTTQQPCIRPVPTCDLPTLALRCQVAEAGSKLQPLQPYKSSAGRAGGVPEGQQVDVQRLGGWHSAHLGPARARVPARVPVPRGRQHRHAAPQPGRAHLRRAAVHMCFLSGLCNVCLHEFCELGSQHGKARMWGVTFGHSIPYTA